MLFFYLSIITGIFSDIIVKILVTNINIEQIIFIRSATSSLCICSYFLIRYIVDETIVVKTANLSSHILRSAILYCGFYLWNLGLLINKVTTLCLFSYFLPSITILLCVLILKEKISKLELIHNFIILSFILHFFNLNSIEDSFYNITPILISVILFSFSDILNKKILQKDTVETSVFYSFILLSFISMPLALSKWNSISVIDVITSIFLGILTFLTLLFLLLSYKSLSLIRISIHKYIEFPFCIFISWITLNEAPYFRDIKIAASIMLTYFVFYLMQLLLKNNV